MTVSDATAFMASGTTNHVVADSVQWLPPGTCPLMLTAEPTVFALVTLYDEGLLSLASPQTQEVLLNNMVQHFRSSQTPFLKKVQDRTVHWLDGVLHKLQEKTTSPNAKAIKDASPSKATAAEETAPDAQDDPDE